MSTNFYTRDHAAEAWFGNYGITLGFHTELPLDAIDRDASRSNQARFEPIDSQRVNQYAAAMKRGDVFPAIVVKRLPSGLHLIVSGNHRDAAALQQGRAHQSAHVIPDDCPQEILDRFRTTANSVHGLEITAEERLAAAETFLARGDTVSQIAETLALPESQARRLVEEVRANQRARRVGIPYEQWLKLPATTRYRFNVAYLEDQMFKDLVLMQFKYGYPAQTLSDMLKVLRTLDTAQQKTDAIAMFEQQLQEQKREGATGMKSRSGRHRPAYQDVNMHWAAISKQDPDAVVKSMSTDEQRVALLEIAERAERYFADLRNSLVTS